MDHATFVVVNKSVHFGPKWMLNLDLNVNNCETVFPFLKVLQDLNLLMYPITSECAFYVSHYALPSPNCSTLHKITILLWPHYSTLQPDCSTLHKVIELLDLTVALSTRSLHCLTRL